MPRYALLGATGSTGTSILEFLLSQAPAGLELSILVRSEEKLNRLVPALNDKASLPFPIRIFQGNVTDAPLLRSCLDGADAIFVCVAENYSTKGISLVSDTAEMIVHCLLDLQAQQGSEYRTPTVIQNRSTTLNSILSAYAPRVVHAIVYFSLYYIYSDLENACETYRRAVVEHPALLEYILVDPPTLHPSKVRTGYRLITDEEQSSCLSYADLGAAMCELASEDERKLWKGKAVGVSATGKVETDWPTILGYLFFGLKTRLWDMIMRN